MKMPEMPSRKGSEGRGPWAERTCMLGSGGGHLASEEEAFGVLLLVPVLLQPPAAHAPPLAIAKSGRGLSRSRAETQIELALIGRQVIEGVT